MDIFEVKKLIEEKELKVMVKDTKQPMLIRVIIKAMLSWKWFDIIEKMLDRWIWKPLQKTETKVVEMEVNEEDLED